MADPFADFAGLTIGTDGGYEQPSKLTMLQPGQAPPAPIAAHDDHWGLVFDQSKPAGEGQQAAPAINIMAEEPKAPTPVMNAPPAGVPGGAPAPAPEPAPAAAPAPVAAPPAAAPPPPPADDGLPPGWTAYKDPGSGNEYYANAETGQVTWEKPAPLPQITAPPPAAAPPPAPTPTHTEAADPFAVFGGNAVSDPFGGGIQRVDSDHEHEQGVVPENLPKEEDDFWAQMGFGTEAGPAPAAEEAAAPMGGETKAMNRRKSTYRTSVINMPNQAAAHIQDDNAGHHHDMKEGLPPGKKYDVTLDRFAYRLGAVFLTAKQVKPNLYCKFSDKVIDGIGHRPIVAYMSASGAAHKANIHPGEILLAVNGREATDPKQARELVQTDKPPLTLTMFRPSLPIIVGENQHMVKYNNSKPRAPTHMRDWKAKYVVVGGIAGKPYAMLMYYSKFEYDRCVAANLAKRHVGHDMKIKAFDLRGCTLVEDEQVRYPETSTTWHFFMIIPPNDSVDGPFFPNIIKISHPNREGLIPVLEAVRRVVKKYPHRPQRVQAPVRGVAMY